MAKTKDEVISENRGLNDEVLRLLVSKEELQQLVNDLNNSVAQLERELKITKNVRSLDSDYQSLLVTNASLVESVELLVHLVADSR